MAHLDLQRGTYAAAEALLGKRSTRKIGHNTRLERLGPDRIGVRYHATVIYTMTADGWAILNDGGWNTVTTWQRINALLPAPWAVWSHRGDRKLYSAGHPVADYVPGLAVHIDSGAVGFADAQSERYGWTGRVVSGFGPMIGVLLTPAEVNALVAADVARQEAREAKRAARLLREHPSPRTFSPDLPALSTVYSVDYLGGTGHRNGGGVHGCAACDAERAQWRELRKARLAAEHPQHPNIASYDRSGPLGRCPWDCPLREGR